MECMQKLLSDLEHSMCCPICLGVLKDPSTTRCDHNFCNECIQNLLKSKVDAVCPLCKMPIRQRAVKKASNLLSVMNAVQDALAKVKQQTIAAGLEKVQKLHQKARDGKKKQNQDASPQGSRKKNGFSEVLTTCEAGMKRKECPHLERRLLSSSSSSSSEGSGGNLMKNDENILMSDHPGEQSITDKVSQWLQNAAPEKKWHGKEMATEAEEILPWSGVGNIETDAQTTCIKRRKVLSPVKVDPQIQESIRNQLWSRDNSVFGKRNVRYTYQARKKLGSSVTENKSVEVKCVNSPNRHSTNLGDIDCNQRKFKKGSNGHYAESSKAYKSTAGFESDEQSILVAASSKNVEESFSGANRYRKNGYEVNLKRRRHRTTSSCPERTGYARTNETLNLRNIREPGTAFGGSEGRNCIWRDVGPSATFSLSQHSWRGLPKHLTDVSVCLERLATSMYVSRDSDDTVMKFDERSFLKDKRLKQSDQMEGRAVTIHLQDATVVTGKEKSSCHSPEANSSIPDLMCCSSDNDNECDSCHEQESNSVLSQNSIYQVELAPSDVEMSKAEALNSRLANSRLHQVTASFTELLKKVLAYDKAPILLQHPGCARLMNKFMDVGACLEKSLGDDFDTRIQGFLPDETTESKPESLHNKESNMTVSSETVPQVAEISDKAHSAGLVQNGHVKKFQDESAKSQAEDKHESSKIVGSNESCRNVSSNEATLNFNDDECLTSQRRPAKSSSGFQVERGPDSSLTEKDITSFNQSHDAALEALSYNNNIPVDVSSPQHLSEKVPDRSKMVNRWLDSSAISDGNVIKPTEENGNCRLGLVVTGLQEREVRFVKAFARKYCGILHDTFDRELATHVIVKATNRLTCDRTLKYLQGIAGKKWVVSLSWILESLKCKVKLSEEDFEVLGDNCMKEFDVRGSLIPEGPMRSRTSKQSYRLLAGFFCICLPPFGLVSTGQAVDLLEMCGASAVAGLDSPLVATVQISKVKETRLIIIDMETMSDRLLDLSGLGASFGATVVTIEWIYESISRFEAQPIADFTVTGLIENVAAVV